MKTDKKFNLIFLASLMLCVIVFGCFGATFAYFHAQKVVQGTFKIGKIGVGWFNGSDNIEYDLTSDNKYYLTGNDLDGKLVRGKTEGTNIVYQTTEQGSTITRNRDLRIVVDQDSADLFLRVKAQAYALVDGEEVYVDDKETDSTSDDVQLIDYIVFRNTVVRNDSTTYVEWNVGWGDYSGDDWYYYLDDYYANTLSGGSTVEICDNIYLSENFPTKFTNKELYISFEFEAIQSANMPADSEWAIALAGCTQI